MVARRYEPTPSTFALQRTSAAEEMGMRSPLSASVRWHRGREEMQQVYLADHPTEAHLVKNFLEANGITALVQGDTLYGLRGEAPFASDTLPTVWVLDDRAVDRARELIAEYRQSTPAVAPDGRPWRCPKCGEQLEPQFTACWQCGTTRPDPA